MVNVELWIVVDGDGDFQSARSEEEAFEQYRDEIGKDGPTRCVKVSLTVPEPKAVEVIAVLSDEPSGVVLEVHSN